MKYLYLCLIFSLTWGACNSPEAPEQNQESTSEATSASPSPSGAPFQGELHYKYTYESSSIPLGYLYSVRPNTGIFAYDLKNYQSTFMGADTIRYYYSSEYNKAIFSKNHIFDASCEDYSVNPDSLLFYKVYDSEELILGQRCMVIEFRSASTFNRYHVSKEHFLAPDTYKKHVAYNWAFYGEQADGGIILRVEHHFPQFVMMGEITKMVEYTNGERAWDIKDQVFVNACR